MGPLQLTEKVFLIGSSELSDARDCSVYVLDFGELVMIDAGAGPSAPQLARNMQLLGLDPSRLSTVVLTHCHIDHVGGAHFFRRKYGARLVMHTLDARPVEEGDSSATAATWYNLTLAPVPVDTKITLPEQTLDFGDRHLICLHTPGHTPGSLSLYTDLPEGRILFGQDIHGPFSEEFGSDMGLWKDSMEKLLSLEADMLCEGHFGVYAPREAVKKYINHYLETYE